MPQPFPKSSSSQRRIQVIHDRRLVPIVPYPPKLSSATYAWDGVLVERHSWKFDDVPNRTATTVLLHLHVGPPGRQVWRIDGKRHSILARPGAVHLFTPGQTGRAATDTPAEAIILAMEPALLAQALGESWPGGTVELAPQIAVQDPQIERLMKTFDAELRSETYPGSLFGDTIAQALAVHLAQRYSTFPPKPSTSEGVLPRSRLNRVLQYIHDQLHEDLPLRALARVANMSPNYFAERFAQTVGLGPHQYVLRCRVERAKHLLRNSRMSIKEVSALTGFRNQGHFAQLFRRMVGVPPTEYRRSR